MRKAKVKKSMRWREEHLQRQLDVLRDRGAKPRRIRRKADRVEAAKAKRVVRERLLAESEKR